MTTLPLLICLDVDGTIVTYDDELTDETRAAVAAVRAAGHHVVIATGRSIYGTLPILDRLNLLTGYAVTSNGSVVSEVDAELPQGFSVIDQHLFDPAPVLDQIHRLLPTAAYAVEDRHSHFHVHGQLSEELWGPVHDVTSMAELKTLTATRIVVCGIEHTLTEFRSVEADLDLQEMAYFWGHTPWLDIGPQGVSKAGGLELLRKRLDIPIGRTVAVGDGTNDIQMLQWAGRGVAMGNANERVQAVADEVIGDVTLNGLPRFLSTLV